MMTSPCGLPIDCGGCTAPETCEGAGVANVCGCVACRIFAKIFGDQAGLDHLDIATDGNGDVFMIGTLHEVQRQRQIRGIVGV